MKVIAPPVANTAFWLHIGLNLPATVAAALGFRALLEEVARCKV